MTGDKAIRVGTAAAVTAVAGFAAVQSYNHIYGLALEHGQSHLDARLLPLSVDGLIVAASLVILYEARRLPARSGGAITCADRTSPGETPWTAWLMLGLGILATIAANVLSGMPHGWLNAVISAWPPAAFIGAVEIVMRMIRNARPEEEAPSPKFGEGGTVPSSVLEAAKASLTATLAAGNPWSVNQLQQQFSLTRAQAAKLRAAVLSETNGHASAETPLTP